MNGCLKERSYLEHTKVKEELNLPVEKGKLAKLKTREIG
jgi:hypothetical protein